MRYGEQRHSVDVLFILLLFAGFLLTAVLLVTMGTGVYRGIVDSMQANSGLRTPYAYIMQTVRRNKTDQTITVEEIDGTDLMAVQREVGGEPYTLRIYVYQDELMEMLTPAQNRDFTLAAGTKILPVQDMKLTEISKEAVLVTITDETGQTDTCVISVRP